MVLHDIRVVNNYLKKRIGFNEKFYYEDFIFFLLNSILLQDSKMYTAKKLKEHVIHLDFKDWLPILKEENERYLATKYSYLLHVEDLFSIFLSFKKTIATLSDNEITSILNYLKDIPVYPNWLLTFENQFESELLIDLTQPSFNWNDASFIYPDKFKLAIHIYSNRKMITIYKKKPLPLYWQDNSSSDGLQVEIDKVNYLLRFYDDWSVLGIDNLPSAPLGVEIKQVSFSADYAPFFYDETETPNAFGNKDWSEF